jgi:hypothetical protein
MSKLGDQLTDTERADIETIMRQSQCYDVHHVVNIYKENNRDVVNSICKLMSLPDQSSSKQDDSSPFTEIREIMKEKYEIYYRRTAN